MSEDKSSECALSYLVECVFPNNQDILSSFFEYTGIENFEDFMSFDVVDFNQPYRTLENANTLLLLSSSLIKNFFLSSPGVVTCYKIRQMTQSRLFLPNCTLSIYLATE
jgi:hypothetical protein